MDLKAPEDSQAHLVLQERTDLMVLQESRGLLVQLVDLVSLACMGKRGFLDKRVKREMQGCLGSPGRKG
jgi:hypothetical protein